MESDGEIMEWKFLLLTIRQGRCAPQRNYFRPSSFSQRSAFSACCTRTCESLGIVAGPGLPDPEVFLLRCTVERWKEGGFRPYR